MRAPSVLTVAALVGSIAFANAAPADHRVPLMTKAPRIDGRLGPAEWAVSAGFDGFGGDGGQLARRRVRGYVGATRTHIYVAIVSRLPDEGQLVAKIDRDSLKAVFDDALEVFVNPTPDRTAQVDYQMLTNSRGFGGYNIHTVGGADESPA